MQSRTEKQQLLTIPQVAERLAVSIPTVWRLIGAGDLASIKLAEGRGGARRVSETALADFIERRTEGHA